MITILNRKELFITLDMKRQADIRNILSANNIEYTVKVKNLNRLSKAGSFGIDLDYSTEYKIFVHKKDYDKALHLIHK